MDNKKMVVHPALTEFALQSAKDWEAVAQERLGVIERLCAEVEALRGELSACTEHPGGCGYWREAAKMRESERDTLANQNKILGGEVCYWLDENHRLREALKRAALAMWNSEANMDNEAADVEEALSLTESQPQ